MNLELPAISVDFFIAAGPIFIMSLAGLILMLSAVSKRFAKETFGMSVLVSGILFSLGFSLFGLPSVEKNYLANTFLGGMVTAFGQSLILGISLIVTLFTWVTTDRKHFFRGEILSLFSFCIAGMMVMVASTDFISIFIGLEIASISIYVLAGYTNPTRKSQEGAIKYFILGSFGTALLLMGYALIYSATGTFSLAELVDQVSKMTEHGWIQLGTILMLSGIAFKLALAPFHLWAPDTYEASPTGITAFMATSVKVMMLVFTCRFLALGIGGAFEIWLPALTFLAMGSILIGNIMALVQSSLKRMLAYSSIAHGGYMAIALCSLSSSGVEGSVAAIMFYLLVYSLVSLSAFGLLMWLESGEIDNLTLDDLRGLGYRHPLAALGLAVAMFALAGMPPTGGFLGKLFVFKSALDHQLYSLVIIGAIGSAISLFYYLRVIVKMYMSGSLEEQSEKTSLLLNPKPSYIFGGLIGAMICGIILIGTIIPEHVYIQLMRAAEKITLH